MLGSVPAQHSEQLESKKQTNNPSSKLFSSPVSSPTKIPVIRVIVSDRLGFINITVTSLPTFLEELKLGIARRYLFGPATLGICAKHFSNNTTAPILEKLQVMKVTGPYALRFATDIHLVGLGKMEIREIADVRDAEEQWAFGTGKEPLDLNCGVGNFESIVHMSYRHYSLPYTEAIRVELAAVETKRPFGHVVTAKKKKIKTPTGRRWSIWVVKTLKKKLKRAENTLKETRAAFEGLNEGLCTAKMAEFQMKLLDGPKTNKLVEGSVTWLASGMAIEVAQDKLATDTRSLLGIHATILAKTTFAHRQSQLRGRVQRFQQEVFRMFGIYDEKEVTLRLVDEDLAQTNLNLDEKGWGALNDVELTPDAPELNIHHLMEAKQELQKGQANDCQGLMLALWTQGLLLRTTIRNANSTVFYGFLRHYGSLILAYLAPVAAQ
ncbi:hypothetical protein FIBSPDRAFT_903076 [Athelia psychrophila]|uniref:Uncharacterized protein n=1 Tax=Athelia psychrophila TaxID=1759441 RepID=A0A167WFS1_9AGAM|nr:hypothetical protein FIBSPDRAFT_903076 [Fibularhizoctonia sp. CBS 109695]